MGAVVEAALYTSGYRDHPTVAVCIALAFSAITILLDRSFLADYRAD